MLLKRLPLMVTLLIFLGSCNLPRAAQSPPPEQVATFVAQTLAAQLSETPPATATLTPQASETPILITPTASVTPTITALPGDPKIALGSPVWQNNLDSGSAFGLSGEGYQDDYTSISVSGGAMQLSSTSTVGWRGWRLCSQKPQNMYLEVTFRTRNCAGSDLYGLSFRSPDYNSGQGYYLGLTCDGRYSLSKWESNGSSSLINPTSNEAILAGPNQTNRLGIMANGSSLKIYINGKLLQELSDSAFGDGGHIGPFIAGYSGNLSLEMDEIAYWNLQ